MGNNLTHKEVTIKPNNPVKDVSSNAWNDVHVDGFGNPVNVLRWVVSPTQPDPTQFDLWIQSS